MTQENQKIMQAKIKDFLIYVLIGIGIVAALMLYASYLVKTKESASSSSKWIWFLIMTALIFGNALRHSKPSWRFPRFWWGLTFFVVFHFVVGILVLTRLTTVPGIDFVAIGVAEYFALDAYLRFLLNKKA